jgi:16S rRNA (cytosine1402-N4)-methyltransferase
MGSPQHTAFRWASAHHTPALATEVVALLRGRRRILDATLGGGGHSSALLEVGATVTALDRDPRAIEFARERLRAFERAGRFHAILGNFAHVDRIDELAGEQFDGILLDLGVSSHQLEDGRRGFSFREGTPLDMRMGDGGPSAADLLNSADERDLARMFRDHANEPHAARLAREIARRRSTRPFATSDDLVGAIRGALGSRTGPADFARLFQAVRIEVNDELGGLERALPVLRDRLHPGGILVAIAYHSGEDRLVKRAFREWSRACVCPPRQPVCTCRARALGREVTRKPVVPSADEVAVNPRARSARLRAWQSAE